MIRPEEMADPRKASVFLILHQLANCHQAVIGYFELNEFQKAQTLAMECRSEWSNLIQKLEDLQRDS